MRKKSSSRKKSSYLKKLVFWETVMVLASVGVFTAAFFLQNGKDLVEAEMTKAVIIASKAGCLAAVIICFVVIATILKISRSIAGRIAGTSDSKAAEIVRNVVAGVSTDFSLVIVVATLAAITAAGCVIFSFTGKAVVCVFASLFFLITIFFAITGTVTGRKTENFLAVMSVIAEMLIIAGLTATIIFSN